MINKQHPKLAIKSQCQLLSISRSSVYRQAKGEIDYKLELMTLIDKQFLARAFMRPRYKVNIKRVRRLMRLMGLIPIYQKPNTSKPNKQHKIYPYLLRGMNITKPNHVWCADITYIPMRKGFLYLVAIMDWATRRVLCWRLSNTMEADFCIEALNEAIHCFGAPKIFNTDQGSQFTSWQWINRLKSANIKISVDSKGRYLHNIFIEQLWRSLKYKCVYLHAWSGGTEARERIGKWIDLYNTERPHKAHCGLAPDVIYWNKLNNQPNDW